MGILNNIKDRFNNAEFTVAPNKKLKTISAEFKKNFDCTLVFYKGAMIADGDMTLAELDQTFGVTVQIKDKAGKECVPNNITIGQAARGEY